MSTTKHVLLSAVIRLCTVAHAVAYDDRPNTNVYRTFGHCSSSERTDLSHLGPGEAAIRTQDRLYRESNGSPFELGECW